MALLGGIAFIVHSLQRGADSIVDLRLFADRNFAAGTAIMAGFSVAMFGGIAILPLFVQGLLGYPVIEAGYLFIPRGLAGGFATVLTGAVLVNRFDPRALAACGLALTAYSNLATGALTLDAGFWQLAWPGIVGGIGMGLVFVPMSTLAFDGIDSSRQNEASGLYGVTRQLGSSIGIAIVGTMVVRGLVTDTAMLTAHVTPYADAAQAYLAPLGLTPQSAEGAALLSSEIARQAALIAYTRVFDALGWMSLALMPLLLFMHRPVHAGGGAPAAH